MPNRMVFAKKYGRRWVSVIEANIQKASSSGESKSRWPAIEHRTELCYVCTALWKSCGCPQWDESRLLAAAELRVDAQLRHPQWINQRLLPGISISMIRQPEVPAARAPPPAPPSLLTTRGAEAHSPPPPPPPAPSRPAIHHTEAHTPAPPTFPQPSRLTTRRAEAPEQTSSRAIPSQSTICCSETNARISAVLARVIEQRPTFTANTATAGEVRQRMIKETMEHLRMDHNCQHTTWKYQRG
ncbi:hypothetical protein K503DRAFT_785972 [Rhizopogon vinicolor AM-OR11-026]|uniref:Uncharacterized protein n=1 Tax=Rhizopogon vinicolor AM-OR11-026 TaxID=1314800 RepID=A0A1B7MNJ7_9AGAM|nr:hypothetical protein K503DRAFT_785972 [Rhizopogon vinicolor AM-OR11-026]